ncbi:MAG: class I SAM-dependent methyltransferase [Bacteroidota bacterium]
MIQINACPVCGQNTPSPFLTCKDYTVSGTTFNISACNNCGFKYTNPIPEPENLGRYYQSEEYISHSDTDKGLVAKLYKIVRSYTIWKKLNMVNKLVARGTILDYGCGTGAFLGACKKDGWKTIGIEPDAGARKIAGNSLSELYDSKEALIKENNSINFDIISLWHVLEHVVDLKQTLEILTSKLNKEGALIIALPNYKSFDANHYHEHWAAYDVPRHLYHFDKSSVSKLMATYGFELQNTLPMLFDSFYVSLLSEKYKNGKGNLLKAFGIGLISNIKALFSREHSSHIYIFKRTVKA